MPDALPDRPFERVALAWIDRFLDHPWRVIALTLALAAAIATGIPKLAFSNNYRAYFSPTNPELVAFDELQATYTKSDNILFVVPSTLLTTLKTVQNLWRLAQQNQNATEIANSAGALYDKFVAFVEDLEDVGLRIDASKASFEKAHNKLLSGRGNLIRRVETLKQLGAKTSKKHKVETLGAALQSDQKALASPETETALESTLDSTVDSEVAEAQDETTTR